MTAFTRFDPFERRITEAIEEIAAARLPDYLDDILRRTARTSQRPRWAFPERWLPVDTTLARPGLTRRVPLRSVFLVALLTAALMAAALYFSGSRQRVPAPFGPARNGVLAYSESGDIFARDAPTSAARLLVSGPGDDASPFFSPDGTLLGYSTTVDGREYLKVANADGSNARQLLEGSIVEAGAIWRPDSRALAVDTAEVGATTKRHLFIVPIDGSPTIEVPLGPIRPSSVSWQPPSGDLLLIRGTQHLGSVPTSDPRDVVDLYTVRTDGTGLHAFGLPGETEFGPGWTLTGPTWSPDGNTIAYNSIEVAHDDLAARVVHFRVRLISADGTNGRAVAGPSDVRVQEAWPLYSPDGAWIVVHRWTWKGDAAYALPEGWLAIMPADGSSPGRDIGPRISGGEDSGLSKVWSPDGSRIIARADNTKQVFSIDPVSGAFEELPWTTELPDWQRIALR